MKYLEVSQKISLNEAVKKADIQNLMLEHLRRAFDVDKLLDKDHGFYFEATSGGHETLTRHARLCADVSLKVDKKTARIIVSGYSKPALSLVVLYSFLFFILLVVGLAPGSIETGYDASGAGDALVFLLFGIFIFYDVKSKILEPQEQLKAILRSLDVEFG